MKLRIEQKRRESLKEGEEINQEKDTEPQLKKFITHVNAKISSVRKALKDTKNEKKKVEESGGDKPDESGIPVYMMTAITQRSTFFVVYF